jgi:prolyl oligopeptidase
MRSAVAAPPPTPAEPITDVLHGIHVIDPYRWLEDQNSPRTRQWIEDQSVYARAYLNAIPGRHRIRTRIQKLLELKEVVSEPWNVGRHFFFLKRREKSEQPVIMVKNTLLGEETVLVDPALRGNGSRTAVSIVAISEDGRYLAYTIRHQGTDHSSLEILDLHRKVVLPDRLPEGFCSGFAFAFDGSGFYYSHRELGDGHPNYCAVRWHAFGTDPSKDQEIFFAGERANLFVSILYSSDAQLLAYRVFSAGSFPRTSIYLQRAPHRMGDERLLLRDVEGCVVPFFVKDRLFAFTDVFAPNFRIVRIEVSSPEPKNWNDVVAEDRLKIQQFAVANEQVFVTRVDRFTTNLHVFRLSGENEGRSLFSVLGSIDLLNRNTNSAILFYSQTSIANLPAVHCYDARRMKLHPFEGAGNTTSHCEIEIEQVSYPSRDGTSIPLLLAAHKGLIGCDPLPTFLTGYGGFGSCVTPRFTALATFLIEQGFVLAVPALRGGSELGEEWHRAGMREKRQNSFDDFVAAAEWLIAKRISSETQIAIGGGSNAGLLVGAAITQRPDLFRAAICLGPLLDMMRYHLFDFAGRWSEEYGSPENENDCKYLLNYSPYHQVQNGIAYPAVLLVSGDADTRCNPMHARKMAARLRAATTSSYPILLDYKPEWGHTATQPLSIRIDALTDRVAFICSELGVEVHAGRRE